VAGNLVPTVLDVEGDTVRSIVELEAMDGLAVLVGADGADGAITGANAGAGLFLLYLHLLVLMKPRLKYTFGFQVISVRFLPGWRKGRVLSPSR
jgi:hypothetical protein